MPSFISDLLATKLYIPPTRSQLVSRPRLIDQLNTCTDYLKQANLFIVPLDNEQRWYRYHHLFTDCLRYYLHLRVGPDGIIELYQRAATWFSENGLLEEAVKHALAANDPDRAANLVEQEIPRLSPHIEKFTILFRLLRMLPEKIIRSRPRLCLEYAWVLFILGKFSVGTIKRHLSNIYKKLDVHSRTQAVVQAQEQGLI